MNPKILIFARDARTANLYAHHAEIKPGTWIPITRPEDLRGRAGATIHKVTTWDKNPEAYRIDAMIDVVKRHSDLTVVEVEW